MTIPHIHTEHSETQRLNVISGAIGIYHSAQRDNDTAPAAYGVAVALIQHGLGVRLKDACYLLDDALTKLGEVPPHLKP